MRRSVLVNKARGARRTYIAAPSILEVMSLPLGKEIPMKKKCAASPESLDMRIDGAVSQRINGIGHDPSRALIRLAYRRRQQEKGGRRAFVLPGKISVKEIVAPAMEVSATRVPQPCNVTPPHEAVLRRPVKSLRNLPSEQPARASRPSRCHRRQCASARALAPSRSRGRRGTAKARLRQTSVALPPRQD